MDKKSKLYVQKLSEDATLPRRGTEGAVGYDLSSAMDMVILAKGKGLVLTDLAIKVPEGTYGRVAPRSGLAWKNHIDVGAGVIDSDFRGNVGVVLFNHGTEDFKIQKGDRIAQLILEECLLCDVEEVLRLDETARNDGGFGSTGLRNLEKPNPDKIFYSPILAFISVLILACLCVYQYCLRPIYDISDEL